MTIRRSVHSVGQRRDQAGMSTVDDCFYRREVEQVAGIRFS